MIEMKKVIPLLILLFASISFASHLPRPTGFVNDFAGIMESRDLLEAYLSQYEKNKTIEIAIVTINELHPDQTLFSYGVELFQEWGIGKKGEDNGILVLIVKNGTAGNRLRIELGYGVQGYIIGSEAGRILDDALPYYENGDYDGVAFSIISGLENQLSGYSPSRLQPDIVSFVLTPLGIYLIIFFAVMVFAIAMRNRCPYCIKGKLKCSGGICTCQRCGKKVDRRRRYAPVLVGGFGGHGGGFSGGGFGGGGSGGGGAGR